MNAHDEHVWFREQIAVAITNGLSPQERSRFAAHADECDACRAELDAATTAERALVELFDAARPAPGFEDRLIQSLRVGPASRRRFVHPFVRRAATGVAAAIVFGGVGYVVSQPLQNARMPDIYATAQRVKDGSNVREMGKSIQRHAADFTTYSAAMDGATTQPATVGQNLSHSYQSPDSETAAIGSGFKLNERFGVDYAVAADINPGAQAAKNQGWDVGAGQAGANRGGEAAGERGYMERTPYGLITQGKDAYWYDSDGVQAGVGASPAEGKFGDEKALAESLETVRAEDAAAAFKPTTLGLDVQTSNETTDAAGKAVDQPGKLQEPQLQQMQQMQNVKVQQQVGQQSRTTITMQREAESGQFPMLSQAVASTRPGAPPDGAQPGQVSSRKVIRSGQLEFEVDRFDSAFARVHQLTSEAGGYIGSTDSQKLPNGKVKGTVTLRVPPDRLDTLVLQLRGIGDLKSQKLGADDVSKQYWDFDSELRAARAMEERLIEIIKTGKGEIKDLLAAEKELGVWRGKIEKLVGEMKYLDNLVALATLSVTMFEKDIATPAALIETETIDAGVETADVESARAAALKAIDEAKGRIVQSDMKRYDAGQFGATIVADVAPDQAGPLLDRIKQLGKVARLDVQRKQTSEGTPTIASPAGRVERRDTRMNLSLYNLANVAPRLTTTLTLAATDVEAAHRALVARAEKAGGRVVTSAVSRDKPERTSASITLEVPSAEADAVEQDVRGAGEVMKLARSENPDAANVTTAKRGFSVQLVAAAGVPPRETTTLQLAAAEVVVARNALLDAARDAGARIIGSQLDENEPQNITATLDLDVPRDALPSIDSAIASAGDTLTRAARRAPSTEDTLDSKVRVQVSLIGAERLPPRETTTLSIELRDVDAAVVNLQQAATSAGGRVIQSDLSKANDGSTVGRLVVELPLAKAGPVVDQAKSLGTVRAIDAKRNAQVPDGKLAKARVEVTLGNTGALIGPDEGLWATIRRALATSAAGLLWSLQVVIIGLCFVLPWVLVLWGGWRLARRRRLAPAVGAAS